MSTNPPPGVRGISPLAKYFGSGSADAATISPTLWNEGLNAENYGGSPEKYHEAILEQYKVYVEMADRVSARRANTNTFFLTINTAVFATIGTFWKKEPSGSPLFLIFPVIVLVAQCLAWFWLMRSYRQLNAAKYAVIGALEERLPASPYWHAEWTALGRGRDPSRYWPLTHLEQWVPALFALCYVGGFLTVLIA